jgi:L-fucose isomerase-like protein
VTVGAAPSVSRFKRAVKVGLLTPYWAFFDDHFPPDYRSSQERYVAALADSLGAHGLAVTQSGLVDTPAAADTAKARFAEAGVDVVVVAATMAAPPTYGAQALQGFRGPIIVWDDRRVTQLARDASEVEATRASSLLGSIMLANVLDRDGLRYLTVSTSGDAAPVARAVAGAAAAAGLRGSRLGLLGGSVEGYGDVLLDEDQAAALGITLVTVGRQVIEEALQTSEGGAAELPPGLDLTDGARPLLARSLRAHAFLRAIADLERLDALALNCHSDVLRWSEEIGVVSCLGSSLLWSSGLPVACTGDAATAVALMLAMAVAGSAQYCEGYLVESATGELVVSSCGMADLSLRGSSEARLCANELYPGRHGLGIATRFDFAAGPATIAAFGPGTATSRPRLVVSTGDISGRGFEHLNGPSGTVAFDRPGPGSASRAWIDAAPAHHLALMRGDRVAELRAAARFLDLDVIETSHEGRVV